MILIENRKKNIVKLKDEYPEAYILDVTSKSEDKWVMLSPFYPHGSIPVPFSEGWVSESVEGIWQGLKVFEKTGIDFKVMREMSMTNIKRSVKTLGNCLGHQKGVDGKYLLGYCEARKKIYMSTYFWVLENRCQPLIQELLDLSKNGVVVLLDYNTNTDIEDLSSPLSHASLIVRYLERYFTDQDRQTWIEQEKNLLIRRKERKVQLKKEAEKKKAQWLERSSVDNPSGYNPAWILSEQKNHKVDFLFFWSHKGSKTTVTRACLSQWYPCSFTIDGFVYNCAEQYMMAEKCRIIGDEETRKLILAEDDPEKIKELGREAKGFNQELWNKSKFEIVVNGNLAKFEQNSDLCGFLMNTKSRVLVEASPYDRIWGIGMREDHKDIQKPEKWYGTNLLGFALMVVRDKIFNR